jgi:hypothetical protein
MVSSYARTKEASQAKYISILNIIQGEVDPTQVQYCQMDLLVQWLLCQLDWLNDNTSCGAMHSHNTQSSIFFCFDLVLNYVLFVWSIPYVSKVSKKCSTVDFHCDAEQ